MKWLLVTLLGATACGRIGFDATNDATGEPVQLAQILAPGYRNAATASVQIDQTAGRLLVAAVYWDATPNTVTLADTAGLAWTAAPKYEIPAVCGGQTGNATGAQLYYAQVTTTQTNIVTVTQTSGGQPLGVMVAEYTGLATTNVVEVESGQVAPSSSHIVSVPAFTTTRFTRIVAFFNDTENQGMLTEGALFTARARDTRFPNMYEDVTVAAGTYMPDGALPTTQMDACWVGDAIAFRTR